MLVLFAGILIGMAIGVAVMLMISLASCLRHEDTSIRECIKDLFRTCSCGPEYRGR